MRELPSSEHNVFGPHGLVVQLIISNAYNYKYFKLGNKEIAITYTSREQLEVS